MPYIAQKLRPVITDNVERLSVYIDSDGDLNFAVTSLVLLFLQKNGKSYSVIARVVGTLTLVILELQRRLIGPYEDTKIAQNGDVHGYEQA